MRRPIAVVDAYWRARLRQQLAGRRVLHRSWIREHGEDLPEVREWAWPHG